MKTSEKLDKIVGLLERLGDRMDAVEANMGIAHSVVREIGQAVGIMSDQVRELHSRFIELADDHGKQLRLLKRQGNGTHEDA